MAPAGETEWWDDEKGREDLERALENVLSARTAECRHPGSLEAIALSLFSALDRVIAGCRNARAFSEGEAAGLGAVLAGLAPEDRLRLVNRDSVAKLLELSPAIASESLECGRLERLANVLSTVACDLGEADRPALPFVFPVLHDTLDAIFEYPSRRLACYGTLRPGERHHSVLNGLEGTWTDGSVPGTIEDRDGYPCLQWARSAEPVPVGLFDSDDLEGAWERIDRFEGRGYVRSLVPVSVAERLVVASCYLADGGQA